jgi:hypothetical protein
MVVAGIVELVQQCLYDQIPLGRQASRRYPFFQVPVGQTQADQIKTFLQTSQLMAAMLPPPTGFIATRLNALFLRDGVPVPLSGTRLYGKTLVSFSVNRKLYWEGPAWLCASPFALFTTPKDAIPRLKEDFGIEWECVGATLQPILNDANLEDVQKGGVGIRKNESFEVTANIDADYFEGLDLAIHIDGVQMRALM